MKAITKFLAGGVAIAALASAAPAAAQFFPGYGSPYGYGYGMPGMGGYGYSPYGGYGGYGVNSQLIVNQCAAAVQARLSGGYGYSPYGYGVNSQVIVNQCANAVQARLSGGYGGYGAYGGGYGYSPYGYAGGGGRVIGISRVEQGLAGAINVHGVATSGRYVGGYTPNSPVDLVWKCRADPRGAIIGIDVRPAQSNYGYQYTPWGNDYSQYGYSRY